MLSIGAALWYFPVHDCINNILQCPVSGFVSEVRRRRRYCMLSLWRDEHTSSLSHSLFCVVDWCHFIPLSDHALFLSVVLTLPLSLPPPRPRCQRRLKIPSLQISPLLSPPIPPFWACVNQDESMAENVTTPVNTQTDRWKCVCACVCVVCVCPRNVIKQNARCRDLYSTNSANSQSFRRVSFHNASQQP